MFCRHCGNQLPDEAKFCNKCGTPTKSIPAPPVAEEPKQETTAPVTVVTAQPAPAVEQAPPPKVEVVQTPVVEQTPPMQEIIESAPAPVEPEPVPVIPEPISEPEPVPESIPESVPEQIPEPEPPAVAPVVPEDIPAADPVRAETVQAPPVVEPPAVPDPVPVAEIEETPVEPIVSIAEAPAEEPDKSVPDDCCPNCRAEITPGSKFCPECGSAVVRPTAAEEKPSGPVTAVPPVSASKPLTFRAYLSRMSTKAKIVIGSVAIIVVILLLCLLGENYDPALVEAKNSYGLSTTVTLDEAIALYNEYLADVNDIEKGAYYDFTLWASGGITDKNDFTVVKSEKTGLTEYQYLNPFSYKMGASGIDWLLSFIVDSETGYLVQVYLGFEEHKYSHDNTNVSDEARNGIIEKCWALTYALVDGNADTLDKLMDNMGEWESGWFVDMKSTNGILGFYASCSTKEYFEEIS